ncbi:MAG TPA: CoA pyrophosphatase [Candidatus Dormibacteraeota bacterium]|nr:CoA pyrophosphatase [Candidatus Dormibacteraeota bacterium]
MASPSPQARAAVAVTIVLGEGDEPCVPIFQRTARMRRHAGQMALPGGRVHEHEEVVDAALRELAEELGVVARREDVLGLLDDFDTVSGFTITPVVVWSGARAEDLRPSEEEVARPFVVPVSMLREAVAGAGRGSAFSLRLPLVEVFAPTAAILYQFSEVALDGRAVRVAGFFQPPWTHK